MFSSSNRSAAKHCRQCAKITGAICNACGEFYCENCQNFNTCKKCCDIEVIEEQKDKPTELPTLKKQISTISNYPLSLIKKPFENIKDKNFNLINYFNFAGIFFNLFCNIFIIYVFSKFFKIF
jgi:hypothetical protein